MADQMNGKEVKAYEFKGMGMLAYIGDFKAVSELREFKDSGEFMFSFGTESYNCFTGVRGI